MSAPHVGSENPLVAGRALPRKAHLSAPTGEARLTSAASTLVPIAALLAAAILWVRYGVDLPFFDDWRHFMDGTIASFALRDLFHPFNDTIYATGKLLDALAVRLLAYNGVVYQLISLLACIGLLVFLQHRLLFKSLPCRAAALGMVACVFMIQPNTYWGIQNFAYHQALPLMAVMSGVALMLVTRLPNRVLALALAVLSLLGGFAYISGAVLVTTTACLFWLFSLRADPAAATRLRWAALGFGLGALCSLPAQLWVILVLQGGNTHLPTIPWTYPWTLQFWAFLLGLVGRTIGAHAFPPAVAIILSLLVGVGFVVAAIACVQRLVRTKSSLGHLQVPIIYLTLFCGTGAYALLIAASRASHGAIAGASLLNWFTAGGARFHFFWLTLMLPWLIGFGFAAFTKKLPLLSSSLVSAALSFLLVGFATIVGVFDYATFYQSAVQLRRADMDCIQEKLLQGGTVSCGVPQQDLTDGLRYARMLDVSFTRQFLFRDELTSEEGAIALETPSLKRTEGAIAEVRQTEISVSANSVDPQLYFSFEGMAATQLETCRVFWIKGQIAASNDDMMQVFFTTPDDDRFAEQKSVVWAYAGGASHQFSLRVGGRDGFAPRLRIDPGNSMQGFTLSRITYSCR